MKKEFKQIMVNSITKEKMDKTICNSGIKMSYNELINWLIDTHSVSPQSGNVVNHKKSTDEKK